jgi:hypothetical protein
MTTDEFRKRLQEELKAIAHEIGWNLGVATERGQAFQLWVARLIASAEEPIDTSPDEALLSSGDLKADVVLEDEANQNLIICQCKYVKQGSPVDESEVSDFFDRHTHYLDSEWVRKHGSKQAAAVLGDYKERLDNNWQVNLRFITTGNAAPRIQELAERKSQSYEAQEIAVTCTLLDFGALKDYFTRVEALEQDIPSVVEFDLPEGRFVKKSTPYPSLVAIVKGNTLRDLKKRYKESLYAWNIRGFLGAQGINRDVATTIREQPDHFFYYNNGVSAICTDFEITDAGRLTANNFQIINGAQTVSTLAAQDPAPEVDVLFRLTKTPSVKTETGFNHDVIRFNNSQNPIKVSDFRSNDQIQLFLEKSFGDRKATAALKKVRYVRKRQVGGKRPLGVAVKLEDMAKLRYAYFFEPTLVHASPRALWSLEGTDSAYAKAFGIDGQLEDSWSRSDFDETCLALALYQRISDDAKARKDDLPFLFRLRFHSLALSAIYVRDWWDGAAPKALLTSSETWERLWDDHAPVVRDVVTSEWTRAEDSDASLFAFVRSTTEWESMKKMFDRKLKAR